METTPDAEAILEPEDHGGVRYLLHTNSYLDESVAVGEVKPEGCPRLVAARQLYQEHAPTDVAGVRAVLSDHTGGICVHREGACTIVSFVAEVREGLFHITRGNPCEAEVAVHPL